MRAGLQKDVALVLSKNKLKYSSTSAYPLTAKSPRTVPTPPPHHYSPHHTTCQKMFYGSLVVAKTHGRHVLFTLVVYMCTMPQCDPKHTIGLADFLFPCWVGGLVTSLYSYLICQQDCCRRPRMRTVPSA